MFQNKTNIEIIGFALGFWIRLSFLRYSLWNKDLLDTHLGLLDTDITSKDFASETSWKRLQDMSSRRLQDMSSRRLRDKSSRSLQDVFSVTIFRLPRRLLDVLWEVLKTSSRRLENVLEDVKLLRWRRVEDVFKTCLEDVFKTSWRPTNVCWVVI